MTVANKCDQRQLVKLVNNFFSDQHICRFFFMKFFVPSYSSRFLGPFLFSCVSPQSSLAPFFLVPPSDAFVFGPYGFPHCLPELSFNLILVKILNFFCEAKFFYVCCSFTKHLNISKSHPCLGPSLAWQMLDRST